MIPIITSIWLCVALLVYYTVFQIFSNFVKAGMTYNTPNRIIAGLRTKYKINIRTFQKNNNLNGFAWHKTIWINENLFKKESRLMSTFFHEMYHVKNNHKMYVLLMRFGLSIIPLLLSFVYWWAVLVVFFGAAAMIQYVSNRFEDKANAYAKNMIDEDVRNKKAKSSK